VRHPLCFAVSLGVVAFSQAIAADPPTSAAAPTAATAPASSPTTAAPEKPTAAAAQAQAVAQAKADALDARFRALGYKPVTRKGLKLYCHNEQQIGSRLERTVCNTPEELDFAILNGRYPGPAGLIGLSGIKFN
jgi:Flp pilus assembly protein TadG